MKILPLLAAGTAVVGTLPAVASAVNGAQLWAQAGCGGCHSLAAAGSSGQVGPNLDVLRPSSGAVATQVTYGGGGMPAFGSSLSASEIQALSAWVASSAGAGPSASAAPAPGAGMSTGAVMKLQRELAGLGYFHHAVTGYYGPVTTAAVKRFQRSAGLTPDGLWGPQSEAALARRLHR